MRVQVSLAGLATSADRIASLLSELADERARRDEMIVALVDSGAPRRLVADSGRVSPKHICQCLATVEVPQVHVEWKEPAA